MVSGFVLVPRLQYPPTGSSGPLSASHALRSLLRTGWGPRGDSGSARSRVRATQPATLIFPRYPRFCILPSNLQDFSVDLSATFGNLRALQHLRSAFPCGNSCVIRELERGPVLWVNDSGDTWRDLQTSYASPDSCLQSSSRLLSLPRKPLQPPTPPPPDCTPKPSPHLIVTCG